MKKKNVLFKKGRYIYKANLNEKRFDGRVYAVCINDPLDWTYVYSSDIGVIYPIIGEID